MIACHICGEEKPKGEFNHIPRFTKLKKYDVTWCRKCQKMWLEMKKQDKRKDIEKQYEDNNRFVVSFD